MKTKLTFIVLCLLFSTANKVWAQQDPKFNQYMFNTLIANPGYAGSREALSIVGLYRNQWQMAGIDGGPVTSTFSIHAPVAKDKVGLGFTLMNDKIAKVINTTTFIGSYAFRIKVGKNAKLALGLQAGASFYRADLPSLITNYNQAGGVDPAFSSVVNTWLPNFGFGLYYYTNKYYVGVSVPHIMNNRLAAQDVNAALANDNIRRAQQYQHFFGMAGYVFDVGKNVKARPSIMAKYVTGSPLQIDVNANFWFFELLALGASYRTGYGLIGMAQLQISPQLLLGYSYDYPTNALSKVTWGSHEIMLRYEFGSNKTRIITPRYF